MPSMMPRWLHLLKEAFTADTVVYTLATVEDGMPRARTVVHRGVYMHDPSRPLLYTNTDVRTPKVRQLHASPASEAVFYFPGTPERQMRITARAYVLPAPSHAWRDDFPAQGLSAGTPIDWDECRLHAFYAISPVRRASFATLAVPGTPLQEAEAEIGLLGTDASTAEERQLIQRALDHFALVVLEPVAVDYVQLSSPIRRTAWKRLDNGEWEEGAVAP